MSDLIYLDNAATTPIDPGVYNAMLPWLNWGSDGYGNAGSLHSIGRRAKQAVENARVQVAEFIGSEPEQIIFTSGGTEGNNLVFLGLEDHLRKVNRKKLLVSAIEHDSVLNAANAMQIKRGFHVCKIPPCLDGRVVFEDAACLLDGSVGLVSVMLSNNETGVFNPDVPWIAAESHRCGALFHTDAVQAAGFEKLDVEKLDCDFMTISSHKIHGPKGIGAVFAKDPSLLSPVLYGGSNQEFGLRGGTENVAGIVGFGKACEIAKRDLEKNRAHIEHVAMVFMTILSQRIGYCCVKNGLPDIVGNKTVSLRFEGIDAETLLLALDSCGVCASAGSACNSVDLVPSHVLMAMGLNAEEAKSSVRFSFSKMTSSCDAAAAANIVANCVDRLLSISHGGA